MKNQIILSVIESKNYNKTGEAVYKYGGLTYHVKNIDGTPRVVLVDVPQDELAQMEVIVRK